MPLARLTANNGVVSEIAPEWTDAAGPHDRQIAHLCADDRGNSGSKGKRGEKMSLYGDNYNCVVVSGCEHRLGGT